MIPSLGNIHNAASRISALPAISASLRQELGDGPVRLLSGKRYMHRWPSDADGKWVKSYTGPDAARPSKLLPVAAQPQAPQGASAQVILAQSEGSRQAPEKLNYFGSALTRICNGLTRSGPPEQHPDSRALVIAAMAEARMEICPNGPAKEPSGSRSAEANNSKAEASCLK